jgi:hypothetical protein
MLKRIEIIFPFLALCAVSALAGAAREEHTRTFQKTVPLASGQRLEVENKFGDVLVRTQPKGEVSINATIKASADDAAEAKSVAEKIVIDVRQSGAVLTVRTEYPQEHTLRNLSFSVSYDIVMPEAAPLTVHNSFGGVVVTDLKANAAITNSHGKLVFKDGRGTHRLENSFGPIEVERNSGDVSVVDSNASVRAADITGSLDLRNRFGAVLVRKVSSTVTIGNANGSVELTEAGGNANVTNSFGAITVRGAKAGLIVHNANGGVDVSGVTGTAELTTTFGRVDLRDVTGAATVRDSNGTVTVQNVSGSVDVKDSFGSVEVRDVGKDARVVNANGAIRITGAKGAVKAISSFASIQVDGAGGAVEVENSNGAVVVAGVPAKPCSPIVLKTSFAPLKVHLPEDAGYNLTAKTSFGRINSELAVTASGAMGGDSLTGRIGGGGCELRLTTSNGGIEILKAAKR